MNVIEMFVPYLIGSVFVDALPRFAIVIHKTAGFLSAQDVAHYFMSGSEGRLVCAHYVIGQDGALVQCVRLKDGAAANGIVTEGYDPLWDEFVTAGINLNTVTISIEHVDPAANNSTPLTDAQKLTSFLLVQDLCTTYGIDAQHIMPHSSITNTTCPGNYPLEELRTLIAQGQDMLQPNDPFATRFFDTSNEHAWKCKNGFKIQYGILQYYRKIQGAPRLPLSEEMYSVRGIAWQAFESGIIVYDPNHLHDRAPFNPCYLEKLDSSLAQTILKGTYKP